MSICHLNIAKVFPEDIHSSVLCKHCGKVHRWDYHHGKDLYVSLCGHHVKGDTYMYPHDGYGTLTCDACGDAWDDLYPRTQQKYNFLAGLIFPFDMRPAWYEDDKYQPIFQFNLKQWLQTGIG